MRRAQRLAREIGEEFRHARSRLGLSQQEVAAAARIHRSSYARVEAGKLASLQLGQAARIAAVLGLDLAARVYPGGPSVRDAGQAPRLAALVVCVAPPLSCRTDVPLPAKPDRLEQRAWDLLVSGRDERTAIEFEARLYDIQEQTRRLRLKWRDDPVEHLLLVIADTTANRRVLDEFGDLLADFPRQRTATVLQQLRSGHHPPTGLILFSPPRRTNAPRRTDALRRPGPDHV
jgi:transcriptional regulator with XRE-family HTH domain